MAPDPRKFMDGPFSLSVRNIKCLAFGISGVASPLVNGPYGIYRWPPQNLWVAPKILKKMVEVSQYSQEMSGPRPYFLYHRKFLEHCEISTISLLFGCFFTFGYDRQYQ